MNICVSTKSPIEEYDNTGSTSQNEKENYDKNTSWNNKILKTIRICIEL